MHQNMQSLCSGLFSKRYKSQTSIDRQRFLARTLMAVAISTSFVNYAFLTGGSDQFFNMILDSETTRRENNSTVHSHLMTSQNAFPVHCDPKFEEAAARFAKGTKTGLGDLESILQLYQIQQCSKKQRM